jgi:site-specific recombinase XerD
VQWPVAIARRPRLLEIAPELPAYLLLPEVQAILTHAKDGHLRFFLDTLWHTGARISEVLALTAASFNLAGPDNADVILTTLKQRGRGRPRKGVQAPTKRLVPLADPLYLDTVERYLATHKPKPGERIFPFTDRYYRKLLSQVIDTLPEPLPIPVSPHTFRHSFAVNLILHGRDIRLVQKLLGHRDITNTAIYTNVLAGDLHHLMRDIQFQ